MMHDIKSRRGIHQIQPTSETGKEQYQARKSTSSKPSSFSGNENNDEEELETDSSNEESPKQYKKTCRLYPDLPKEDINVINQKAKLDRQAKKEKYQKSQNDTESSSINYYVILIVGMFAVVLAYFFFPSAHTVTSCETPMCLFQDQFKNLRYTFVNQEKLSWKVIGSAVISVVNKTKHTQPAVILLAANKDAKIISSCIARQLASSVALSYKNSPIYPRVENKQSISSEKMKNRIYTMFKESFEKENHHVVVLENIDSFSADTAMALHLFCDHENAPYKNIVIILTVNVDEFSAHEELRLRDMDRIARNHLDKIWGNELDNEKRAALLSRITSSVAVIRSEKNVPKMCHN